MFWALAGALLECERAPGAVLFADRSDLVVTATPDR
jgi:hypothetical protein